MKFPILLLLMLAAPAWAQDSGRGRLLYDTHCLSCHYESIHKRDASRSLVKTLPQLRAEVALRAGMTKHPFSAGDLDDITEYLNRSHYRLQK